MISPSAGSSGDETIQAPLATRRQAPTGVAPEFVLTATPRSGEPVQSVFDRLADDLATHEARIVSLFVFGSLGGRTEIEVAMRRALGSADWPITWADGGSCHRHALAGVQAFAISRDRPVDRVTVGGRVVGSVYEDGAARHCLLGGLGPTSIALRPAAQVQQTFGNLEWALDHAGFGLGDVVRTWFYNDDIVAWYPEFNRVRSALYAGVTWASGAIPASTGIGARNPAGAALTLAAWAVQPLTDAARVQRIDSPLQCPAPAYGSAFSRAMEITCGDWRRLLVSGTASIHPDGRTAWIGDPKKQVALTMEVVAALLQSRGMNFRDITRATAYFEHPSYQRHFAAWCAARDLVAMPVVATHADICRDDLWFEIELDAVTNASRALTRRIPGDTRG